jgi:hypothetical protein
VAKWLAEPAEELFHLLASDRKQGPDETRRWTR